MTESNLQQLLKEKEIPWETFFNFIKGQTFQLTPQGEPYFFQHDIDRFFAQQAGTDNPHDWD